MEILQRITGFILDTVGNLGYLGIVFLMFLESSFFPFPSEVVMIPAGYLSARGEMNLIIAILCGIAGSVFGALFNYYISLKLGRPFILKYGKYLFINERRFRKAEDLFNKHGEIITFTGRLIPGIRQYISFPPGISRMNLKNFIIFTGAGAGIWVTVLALLGYFIGENQDLIEKYLHQITVGLVIFSAVLLISYWIYRTKTDRIGQEEVAE